MSFVVFWVGGTFQSQRTTNNRQRTTIASLLAGWLISLIIPLVPRRVHISQPLRAEASIELDPSQAHHVRDVLRLKVGDAVELFNDAGQVAAATITRCEPGYVGLTVGQVQERPTSATITIASAIPKGDRADWMIEKLSELGVTRFIPLATARSVVLPTGQNKRDRWIRIATEAAKQSRRAGVMQIDELTPVERVLENLRSEGESTCGCYLSTEPAAVPISSFRLPPSSFLFIGPEGGWTPQEIAMFESAHLTGLKLTGTILRIETAAIAAAAVVACSTQSQG